MEQFLQHTSRDDDPHLHVHNLIATIAQTVMDGKWRTPDSYGYNQVYMAVSAIVSLHLEAAMRRRFGVRWMPRGCQCDRGRCDDRAVPEQFRLRDRRHFPCRRRVPFHPQAELITGSCVSAPKNLSVRTGSRASVNSLSSTKKPGTARASKSPRAASTLTRCTRDGRRNSGNTAVRLSPSRPTCGTRTPSAPAAAPTRTTRPSLTCSRSGGRHSRHWPGSRPGGYKWTRYQLIHELGSVLPPEIRDLKPERMLPLLDDLADRTLAGEFEPVVCLEKTELVDVPDSLRRDDGLPVYRRHMTTKYATAARLSLEEQLLADAGRRRAPLAERERAAYLLGSDSATLTAQLDRKPEAGSDQQTAVGLRLDQAAAIWAALTDRKTSTVLTGPAGGGENLHPRRRRARRPPGRDPAHLRHRHLPRQPATSSPPSSPGWACRPPC